jgi:hypothetical protein
VAHLPARFPLRLGDGRTVYSRARDPEISGPGPSEMSWGRGPAAPGKEHAPPSQGGVYRGKCPPVNLTRSDDLSVRARETRRRPGDPPRGNPGRRIG